MPHYSGRNILCEPRQVFSHQGNNFAQRLSCVQCVKHGLTVLLPVLYSIIFNDVQTFTDSYANTSAEYHKVVMPPKGCIFAARK